MKPETSVVTMPHFCQGIQGNNGFISFSNTL